MTRPFRLLALLGVLVLALAAASPAVAATPRASFNDLEDEVMCDVCGIPLNIAESPRAEQQRVELKQMIAQGLTKKQIKDRARDPGPARRSSRPRRTSGFSLAAYIVPIAAVLAALVGARDRGSPRWRRRGRPPAARWTPRPALSAADTRRLDEDLARFGA